MIASLGRSGVLHPDVFAKLAWPKEGAEEANNMLHALQKTSCLLDVTDSALLWGTVLNREPMMLLYRGGADVDKARDAGHAEALVGADLVQALSALGVTQLDFFALRMRRTLELDQLDGAVRALEGAREDGLVRSIAASFEGPAQAAMLNWQFRDAFDLVIAPAEWTSVKSLARERRVAFVAELGEPGTTPCATHDQWIRIQHSDQVKESMKAGKQ